MQFWALTKIFLSFSVLLVINVMHWNKCVLSGYIISKSNQSEYNYSVEMQHKFVYRYIAKVNSVYFHIDRLTRYVASMGYSEPDFHRGRFTTAQKVIVVKCLFRASMNSFLVLNRENSITNLNFA